MAEPGHGDYLRTQEVARALGVGVSTVKRWVDSGALSAIRTVGGHRLVARAEAERFAASRGRPLAGAGLPSSLPGRERGDGEGVRLASCMDDFWLPVGSESGDSLGPACETIRRTFEASGPVVLADDLIRPAMERLGNDWAQGVVDVYQEHWSTHVVAMAVSDLIRDLAARASGGPDRPPLAMGASPSGDGYVLPGLLCELTMRWLGWEVMNLGVGLPLESLARAVSVWKPRLVWISVSHLEASSEASFVANYRAFFETAQATGTAVILGGRALDRPPLRAQLVACAFGDRMAHLAAFGRVLFRTEHLGHGCAEGWDLRAGRVES